MRRRVHKTATRPPFPHALTEVLTCVQFTMHSDLPRDIPFIPFLFSQCFLSFFSHPFNFYLIIVELESSRRERNPNFPASPLRRAGRQGRTAGRQGRRAGRQTRHRVGSGVMRCLSDLSLRRSRTSLNAH